MILGQQMDDCKVVWKDVVFEDKGRVKVCQRTLPELTQWLSHLGLGNIAQDSGIEGTPTLETQT